MEGATYDYVAEHEAATKRLNDLMAEYMAVKKAEREVRNGENVNSLEFDEFFFSFRMSLPTCIHRFESASLL